MMIERNRANTATIIPFPTARRMNSRISSDQARRLKEMAAAKAAPVAETSGWYHQSAMDEQAHSA